MLLYRLGTIVVSMDTATAAELSAGDIVEHQGLARTVMSVKVYPSHVDVYFTTDHSTGLRSMHVTDGPAPERVRTYDLTPGDSVTCSRTGDTGEVLRIDKVTRATHVITLQLDGGTVVDRPEDVRHIWTLNAWERPTETQLGMFGSAPLAAVEQKTADEIETGLQMSLDMSVPVNVEHGTQLVIS